MAHPFEHLLVYDDGVFRVAQDRSCPIPGFMIVSTIRPIRSFDELSPDDSARFGRIVRAVRAAQRSLGHDRVYLFESEDSASPFHLWMLPRHAWMDRFGTGPASLDPVLERAKSEMMDRASEVEASAARIKELLAVEFAR